MEVSGPASSAVGRPLTEDEMADVKKEASAGPDSGRGAARCEAEAPLERAGAPRSAEFPGACPGSGQGRARQGRAGRGRPRDARLRAGPRGRTFPRAGRFPRAPPPSACLGAE